jgi:hypothetical protein
MSEVDHVRARWESHEKAVLEARTTTTTSALRAAATLVLINGGGIAALGALSAQLVGKVDGLQIKAEVLPLATAFFVGLIVSALLVLFIYWTNFSYLSAMATQKLSGSSPHVHANERSQRWLKAAIMFHVLSMLLGVSSFLIFAYGIYLSTNILDIIPRMAPLVGPG